MKIKNSILATTILLTLLSAVAQAQDGTMTVEGKITDGTCTVLGAAMEGEIPSPNASIRLPKVSTALTKTVGNSPFYIYLRGCKSTAALKNIVVGFYANNTFDLFTLNNVSVNGASNLGIGIIHWYEKTQWGSPSAGTEMAFNGQTDSRSIITLPENQEDITVMYSATFKKLNPAQPITAGRISSTAYYEVTYF